MEKFNESNFEKNKYFWFENLACQRYSRRPLTDYILGGIPVEPGEYPWMVFMSLISIIYYF